MLLPALLLHFAALAADVPDLAIVDLRRQAVADPAGAIRRGRAWLDAHHAGSGEEEREVLRWMGKAAFLAADRAALTEVTVRLDGLADSAHDPVAAAYAGFLRADRAFEQGAVDAGMKEALRAAERLQDRREPALRGLVAYQLCDALSSAEEYTRAQAYCGEAEDVWRLLHDEYELARTENVHSYVFYNQEHVDQAVRLSESARRRFLALGETESAGIVGDNLARMYIEQGRAAQALELSQAALAAERKSGRLAHALLSRANIARAYSALGRHTQALAEIAATLDEAKALKLDGPLPDYYDTQSRLAEAAGDMPLALAAARKSQESQDRGRSADLTSDYGELEARYAAREKDLRIGELERDNRLQQLELEAAKARDSARAADESRRRWLTAAGVVLTLSLAAAVLLLALLLRAQRRHAARLHQLAHTDQLTGCGNRRAFYQRLEAVLARENDTPAALLLIDLDHFKRINDRYGHPFGDAVLRQAADTIQVALNGQGYLARLGGEEFGVLADLEPPAALRLAETLRAAVATVRLDGEDAAVTASASIGLAMYDAGRYRYVEAWLKQADRALYAAKSRGRNRVVASTSVG